MTKTRPGFFTTLTSVVFVLVLSIPLAAWRAYAAVKLWQWFVAPIWPDLWHPTIYSAFGVILTLNAFMPQAPKETAAYAWAIPFVAPATFLLFGYAWLWLHLGA